MNPACEPAAEWRSSTGPPLDLDRFIEQRLVAEFSKAAPRSDGWRVLGFCLEAQPRFAFLDAATYPRPDHPEPQKRWPLAYTLVAILVGLRTTLENEQRAMEQIFRRFPNEHDLQDATADQIKSCIECAGMAETKSIRIRRALDAVLILEGGLEGLRTLPRAEARATVLAFPGFGPKAADCLLSVALGHGSIAVDVNVFRVSSALLGMSWSAAPEYANSLHVAEVKSRLDQITADDSFLCQIVHSYLMLFGKELRIRRHDPLACAIGRFCGACENSEATQPRLWDSSGMTAHADHAA